MVKTNKTGFLITTFLGVILICSLYLITEEKEQNFERNYKGEYMLGLIPNSQELPPTRADIIIGYSPTKELVKSPFGYIYERNK